MVTKNKQKNGFTLVELIIVIAVIGVLAAILIPTFANVIDKANLKSATSDAKNSLTIYLADKAESQETITDTLFFVEKANKMYLFGCFGEEGELVASADNPYDVSEFLTRGSSTMESTVASFLAKLVEEGHVAPQGSTPQNETPANLVDNVCIWSGYTLINTSADACRDTATAYVTISSEGSLVMTRKAVNVYDIDADGALTINDALILAHKNNYSGGASGYAAETTQWGLSVTKLWGVSNGGSYGYYINNASAWSLTDSISDNDYLYAFSYADAATYSDTFSYFDNNYAEVTTSESVTLTLNYSGYDSNWNPVTAPLADAVITIDGVATSYKTDANGQVTIPMNTAGTFTISAISTSPSITHLVPPVCVVVVSGS